jgi:hypothetical protein
MQQILPSHHNYMLFSSRYIFSSPHILLLLQNHGLDLSSIKSFLGMSLGSNTCFSALAKKRYPDLSIELCFVVCL